MTLVIGLKSDESVVIAAEQEEGCGITAKRSVNKLELVAGNDWVVVAGGAGDAAIADNATRMMRRLLTNHKGLTEDQLSKVVDTVLDEVHTKYIDKDPRSEGLSLVVGASCSDGLHLISTSRRTPQFQDYMAYAGIGSDIGIFFIDRLHSSDDSWKQSVLVASYVMMQVKESTVSCSGESQIIVLQKPPNPRWRSLGQPETDDELEFSFHNEANLTRFIRGAMDAVRTPDFDRLENYQDEFHPEPMTEEELEEKRLQWLKEHPEAKSLRLKARREGSDGGESVKLPKSDMIG